jgi:hypothetical protein
MTTTMDVAPSIVSWPESSGPAPKFATRRTPERPTYGDAVGKLAKLLGTPLMPWQQYVVDVALEIQSIEAGDPSPGEWAFDEVVVTTPRQAGKTTLIRPVMVHRCGTYPQARVWMTAQSGRHARRRWMDATDILVQHLSNKVKRKIGVGHEELRWLATNSTLEPFAPNQDSLHGETPDLVTVDEFWTFDAEAAEELQQAYLPGFTTKDAQAWLTSTAGDVTSAWFNEARASGRASCEEDVQLGTAFFEWGIPDVVDGESVESLDDATVLELVLANHPSNGHTLRPASIASAQAKMSRSEFLRAYGNLTDSTSGRPPEISRHIIASALSHVAVDGIPMDSPVGMSVEVDPDRRESSISVAWRDTKGIAHSKVLRSDPGTRWLAAEVVRLVEDGNVPIVAINDAGPAKDIADELERLEVPVLRVGYSDFSAACVRWWDELHETDVDGKPAPTVQHCGHPRFVDAIDTVRRIKVRSGAAWVFRHDIEPIPAVVSNVLSVWAFDHLPEPEYDPGKFKIL